MRRRLLVVFMEVCLIWIFTDVLGWFQFWAYINTGSRLAYGLWAILTGVFWAMLAWATHQILDGAGVDNVRLERFFVFLLFLGLIIGPAMFRFNFFDAVYHNMSLLQQAFVGAILTVVGFPLGKIERSETTEGST